MLIPLFSGQVWSGISLFFFFNAQLRFPFVHVSRYYKCQGQVRMGFSPIMPRPGFKEMKFQTKFCHSLASKNPKGSQFRKIKEIPVLWLPGWKKNLPEADTPAFWMQCPCTLVLGIQNLTRQDTGQGFSLYSGQAGCFLSVHVRRRVYLKYFSHFLCAHYFDFHQ